MTEQQEFILKTDQVVAYDMHWEHARQLTHLLAGEYGGSFYLVPWSVSTAETKYYVKSFTKLAKHVFHDCQQFALGVRAAWR